MSLHIINHLDYFVTILVKQEHLRRSDGIPQQTVILTRFQASQPLSSRTGLTSGTAVKLLNAADQCASVFLVRESRWTLC